MGDHFVLLVDRLITESTLEAIIESRNKSETEGSSLAVEVETEFPSQKRNCSNGLLPQKLVECRICKDEDEDSNMETPCSCCGSLKYAHRKCVQRWCNEKGDTMCEICQQQFKPDYTAPPHLVQYGGIQMNFRGNWEIPQRDLHNFQFIPMVTTERDFLHVDYDDYPSHSRSSMKCCRSVAIIFVVLLILRHTLPVMIHGVEEYSFTVFILLLLRIAGILLPVYLMARALTGIRRQHRQRELHDFAVDASDEHEHSETELRPHVIHVH